MLFSPSNPIVCSLCDDEVSESSAYTINSTFLEAIRSVKRFKGVDVNLGEKVCSKHLIESKDAFGNVSINIRSYESVIDTWNLSPPHKRAKRREIPSSRASALAHSTHGISDFSIASSPSVSLSDSQHGLSSDFTSNSYDLMQGDSVRIHLERSPHRRGRRSRAKARASKDSSTDNFSLLSHGESASSTTLESIHARASGPKRSSIESMQQKINSLEAKLRTREQHSALREAEFSQQIGHLNQILRDLTPLQSIFHLLQVRNEATLDEMPMDKSTPLRLNRRIWIGVEDFQRLWLELENEDEFMALEKSKGPPSKFTLREKLCITLISLKRGFCYTTLASLAKTTDKTITKIVRSVLSAMLGWATKQTALPSIEDWSAQNTDKFTQCFPGTLMFFIDGTVIEIRASNLHCLKRTSFNPKHKIPSLTFTILVDLHGKITWVSKTHPGNTSDRKVVALENLGLVLCKKYAQEMAKKGIDNNDGWILAIGGDKGYPGTPMPQFWKLYITQSGEHGPGDDIGEDTNDLNKEDTAARYFAFTDSDGTEYCFSYAKTVLNKTYFLNGNLATFRSVVERTFACIKDWELLSNVYFTSTEGDEINNAILAICGLHNHCKYNFI